MEYPDPARNCSKHVEFYSNNKFEKLVHLFGFITIIHHDARSSDCQCVIISCVYCMFSSG
jgi:hypothetical protein